MLKRISQHWYGSLPLSGVLLVLALVFNLWRKNLDKLAFENVWPTIVAILLGAIGLLITARVFTKTWTKAGFVQTVILVYIFYAADFTSWFNNASIKWAVLAGFLVITVSIIRVIKTSSMDFRQLNSVINLLGPVIVLGILLQVIAFYSRQNTDYKPIWDYSPAFNGTADSQSPDVWHFVFDRYAGLDILEDRYNYDNRPFLEALRSRGFHITEPVASNYQRTSHSLASTLNATYLDEFAKNVTLDSDNREPFYSGMTNNAALQFFKAQGYEVVFSGSWWDPTRRSPEATSNINTRDLPEIGRAIFNRTVLGKTAQLAGLPYGDARQDQCVRVKYKFRKLASLASDEQQKYVFAHFLIPHPPYVINVDGTCRTLEQASSATRRDNYIGQVEYSNSKILKLIDAIIGGPRPATIIVTSDEGPWPAPYIGDERYIGRDPVAVNWAELTDDQLREKMGIILASRMYDGADDANPKTPVNIYPAILNNGFSGQMALVPQRNLVYLSHQDLYKFKDVTSVFAEQTEINPEISNPK